MPTRSRRLSSAAAAGLAFVALSAVAGLLVSVAIAPAVVVAGKATAATVETFDNIPEFIEIGKLHERNVLFANKGGQQVPFATLYNENRVMVAWYDVSPHLKDAVVAGEDRRFFEHGAIDLNSLVRAGIGSLAKQDLGAAGGGSTLAMQLVRNVLIAKAMSIDDEAKRRAAYKQATQETAGRKVAEMKLAIGLEKKYTKNEVLLAYLNIAYFGDGAYGVEAASQRFFGKSAKTVTAAEAASLIATVQYPETRNMSRADHYPANAERRNVILDAMLAEKKIDAATHVAARASAVASYVHLTPANQGCMAVTESGAQQWCDLIRRQVKALPSLGTTPAERERNWNLGGYEVHTTLDLDQTANAKAQLGVYAPNTEARYDLGGVVASVEASTGRVLVLAQNKDFNDTEKGGGSTTSALNYAVDKEWGGSSGFQPGSTYKPFTLLQWLKDGHKLGETVDARPRNFAPMMHCGSRDYTNFTPKNDNGGNPGTVTARQATVNSINTAYVAMARELDLCDIRDTAQSLGVHPSGGGELLSYPSSVIGAGSLVSPLTMASAFATIASGGTYCSPVTIESVTYEGKQLAGHETKCEQVLDSKVAAQAASAMQGVFTGGTATLANPRDGVPILGKTGTTDRAEQTWLVGGSSKVVTASWVGNISGHQNQYNIRGANGAMNQQRLYLWKHVQQSLNGAYGGEAFAAPPVEYVPRPKPVPQPDADDSSEPSGDGKTDDGSSSAED